MTQFLHLLAQVYAVVAHLLTIVAPLLLNPYGRVCSAIVTAGLLLIQRRRFLPVLIAEACLIVSGLLAVMTLPLPPWKWLADIAWIVPAFLGVMLGYWAWLTWRWVDKKRSIAEKALHWARVASQQHGTRLPRSFVQEAAMQIAIAVEKERHCVGLGECRRALRKARRMLRREVQPSQLGSAPQPQQQVQMVQDAPSQQKTTQPGARGGVNRKKRKQLARR